MQIDEMPVCDYITEFFIRHGTHDVFGYPGGMITRLMDSFTRYNQNITAHLNYHEQASAFCACGYAQIMQKPGIAYSTSGPGATNLITGIANAYYDSIPCIFITGQVNTYEARGHLNVRQKGFQECDIVSIVNPITKYAVRIDDARDICYELEKAYFLSMDERPGPVLLDVPFNIQREMINPRELRQYVPTNNCSEADINYDDIVNLIYEHIGASKRPLILAGAGIRSSGMIDHFRRFIQQVKIPVVTSMLGVDCLPDSSPYKFGFIGAYGHRYANIIQAKCDLLISLGSRLDTRQTGVDTESFAEKATFIRIDISEGELTNKIKKDEIGIRGDLRQILPRLATDHRFSFEKNSRWIDECSTIKHTLLGLDRRVPNDIVYNISTYVPENAIITTDVGQNQVWVAQDFHIQDRQRILFSGGHGAMGYSLPAAIGAYYAEKGPVIVFTGDGGLQMNIQELQFIQREHLPIKIIILNNSSLGMIRHFQEMYFNKIYTQTTKEYGYTVPNFCQLANAYGIPTLYISKIEDIAFLGEMLRGDGPLLVNVVCDTPTYVYPKLGMGRPIYDQEPLLERECLDRLMHIEQDL